MPAAKRVPRKKPPLFPLAAVMESRGVSLAELARRTGITRELLRGYAKGYAYPTWPSVWLLVTALGLHLGDLDPSPELRGGRHAE